MVLTADVGNTSTVIGLWRGGELVRRFRLATNRERSADEYRALLGALFAQDGLSPPKAAAIASVVPPVERELEAAFKGLWGISSLHLRPDNAGLSLEVENPAGVGPDRLANALAALELARAERYLVVDFGTATTFDLVAEPDRYLGGAIAPGPETAAEALVERAAMLFRFDPLPPPRSVVGKNTAEAMRSGIVLGYASLVEGMVARFRNEVGPLFVVATGGFAPVVARLAAGIDLVDPDLTLKGIYRFFQRRQGPPPR